MITTKKKLSKYFNLSEHLTKTMLDRFRVERFKEGKKVYYNINLKQIEAIKRYLKDKGSNYDEILRLRRINRELKQENKTLEKLRDYLVEKRGQLISADEIILMIGI